jgi:hypothetical protein
MRRPTHSPQLYLWTRKGQAQMSHEYTKQQWINVFVNYYIVTSGQSQQYAGLYKAICKKKQITKECDAAYDALQNYPPRHKVVDAARVFLVLGFPELVLSSIAVRTHDLARLIPFQKLQWTQMFIDDCCDALMDLLMLDPPRFSELGFDRAWLMRFAAKFRLNKLSKDDHNEYEIQLEYNGHSHLDFDYGNTSPIFEAIADAQMREKLDHKALDSSVMTTRLSLPTKVTVDGLSRAGAELLAYLPKKEKPPTWDEIRKPVHEGGLGWSKGKISNTVNELTFHRLIGKAHGGGIALLANGSTTKNGL